MLTRMGLSIIKNVTVNKKFNKKNYWFTYVKNQYKHETKLTKKRTKL